MLLYISMLVSLVAHTSVGVETTEVYLISESNSIDRPPLRHTARVRTVIPLQHELFAVREES